MSISLACERMQASESNRRKWEGSSRQREHHERRDRRQTLLAAGAQQSHEDCVPPQVREGSRYKSGNN